VWNSTKPPHTAGETSTFELPVDHPIMTSCDTHDKRDLLFSKAGQDAWNVIETLQRIHASEVKQA
jgi:hypothetical protein